eukprot:CAMPEP_0205911198 /NCGR_PEP_ID=MMETSP1325-20131115/4993_1 /ASSEMBLY_ACC=CAM_ASM_000708 /TAXON_ID=236786 /ORGANISM="Florenciella sp., Strain RCC1007" /LENGTH=47 /DNA_ID= /DNA_START= /DNA_END= /DNA_ORIENTATION=
MTDHPPKRLQDLKRVFLDAPQPAPCGLCSMAQANRVVLFDQYLTNSM